MATLLEAICQQEQDYARTKGIIKERMYESFKYGDSHKLDETFMLPIGPGLFYTNPLCRQSPDGRTLTILNVKEETKPDDKVYRTPCLLMYATLQVEGQVMEKSKWIVDKIAAKMFPDQSLRFTNLQAFEYYLEDKNSVDNTACYGKDNTLKILQELARVDKLRASKRQDTLLRPAEWKRFFEGLIKVRHRPIKEAMVAAQHLLKHVDKNKMLTPDVHDFFKQKSERYMSKNNVQE